MMRCTLFGHKMTHVNSKALFGESVTIYCKHCGYHERKQWQVSKPYIFEAMDSMSNKYTFTLFDFRGLEPTDKTYFYIDGVEARLLVSTVELK